MTTLQLIVYSTIVFIIILCVQTIRLYNESQRLLNAIPEAESNISVLRTKRNDLISKLISIVNSYDFHENTITESISRDFGNSAGVTNTRAFIQRLSSLSMSFPELKSNLLYGSLIDELKEVETEISIRREKFNLKVRLYNTLISQFPANILLIPFKFESISFLSEEDLSV
jgi:LemA protein